MTKKISIFPEAKALIFDCDGTLVDNMQGHILAWHKAFEEWGCQCTNEFLSKMAGIPTKDTIIAYNQEFGASLPVEEFSKFKEKVTLDFVACCDPFHDTVDLVKECYGKIPMAVVSGGIEKHVLQSLNGVGIANLFDTIITANTEVKPKPAPDIFLLAAERLQTSPENCQVFEDGDPGIKGAREAGMMVTDVRCFR